MSPMHLMKLSLAVIRLKPFHFLTHLLILVISPPTHRRQPGALPHLLPRSLNCAVRWASQ